MAIYDDVKGILVDRLATKPDLVKLHAKLKDDLGADSLDAVDIMLAIEEKFGIDISDEEGSSVATVAEVVALIEQKLRPKTVEPS